MIKFCKSIMYRDNNYTRIVGKEYDNENIVLP